MTRNPRILLVLLVAMAALAPWYHGEHHSDSECAVCTLVAHGSAVESPIPTAPEAPVSVFAGWVAGDSVSPRGGEVDLPACRGPPAPL